MCHYITATLPSTDLSPNLRRLVERHQLLFETAANPTVEAQLCPAEGYFRATSHWCDCGTGLGAGERAPTRSSLEKRVAKLRKKGWGETKLSRWLDQQESNKRDLAQKKVSGSETPTAEDWHRFLTDVLQSGTVDWVGLLLHWYSESLADEDICISQREVVPFSRLSTEFLLAVEEDVLYEFRKAAAFSETEL